MEIKNTSPKLLVKFKNIQLVFDYCIENKLKFNVTPRLTAEEWEVELSINDVMTAIALGIFVRENKIEVIGLNYGAPKAQIPAAGKALKNVKTLAGKKAETEEIQMGNSGLLDIENSEMENDSFQDKAELVF